LEGAGVAAGATRDEQTKIAEQPRSRQREGQDEQRAEQGVVKDSSSKKTRASSRLTKRANPWIRPAPGHEKIATAKSRREGSRSGLRAT
jgi:hypothetical protein